MDSAVFAALLADASGQATAPQGGGLQQLILPVMMIGLAFYFIILRPQKRDQQRVDDMRNSVRKGDKVKSIGGIHGTVLSVDTTRNIVTVQVDKNVKLDFDRNAIATVTRKEEGAETEPAKPLVTEK
jgi:preprotein translocase subunit YajC